MFTSYNSALSIQCLRSTLLKPALIPQTLPNCYSRSSSKLIETLPLTISPFWSGLKAEWATNKVRKANDDCEIEEVNWLITVFNRLFATQNVILVRGQSEPEYFPATLTSPARIEFANGYFASALHEISHWSIAGAHRRTLPDFGYWYAPDGRTALQQAKFEQVEVQPQAIECLYSLMCGKPFKVSLDNLNADYDTKQSEFESQVFKRAQHYIASPDLLPWDAKTILTMLAYLCHDESMFNTECTHN